MKTPATNKQTALESGNFIRNVFFLVALCLFSSSYLQSQIVPFIGGMIEEADQHLCHSGDPNPIVFSIPVSPAGIVTYQWYYKNGIVSAPELESSVIGWTAISGATAASYDPPSGLTASRTYACRIIATGIYSRWASNVRYVTVLMALNSGTIAAGDQSFSLSGNPNPITLSAAPFGSSGDFQYRWYAYQGITSAPTGSNIPSGWTEVAGATSASYDPPVQCKSITYALRVDPVGSPDCSPKWATGQRRITVNFSPGTLASGNQNINECGDPNNIAFAFAATSGATFQWYYRDGIIAAPSTNAATTGWTVIAGATTNAYNPPAGLSSSRTYGCRVSNCGGSYWATGVRQVTVFPANIIIGDTEVLFSFSGDPQPITAPSGLFSYQWYVYSGLTTAPSAYAGVPSGWTAVAGANSNLFNPPVTSSSRTYALRVGIQSGCSYKWASGTYRIVIANFNTGTLAGSINTEICFGQDPAPFTFSSAPTSTATVKWYRTNSVKLPTSGITSSDTLVATGLSYDAPTFGENDNLLTANVFENSNPGYLKKYYARITNGSTSYWLEARNIAMRIPFSTGLMPHNDLLITDEYGNLIMYPHDVCYPNGPDTVISYHQPLGGSTSFVLFQWYVSSHPNAGNGPSCDTLAGMHWVPIGAPVTRITDIESNSPQFMTMPTQLPQLTGALVQSTQGAYHLLTYKLHVTPIKSLETLEPVCVGSYVLGSFNYCGSYAIAGPGSFMSNQQQVRVWQCGTTARFAENTEDKSIQTSKPDYLSEAFPNPANDVLNIAYSLPSGTSKARIALYSNSGQLIESFGIQSNDTSNSAQFNVSNLPSGLYTASLEVDGMVIGNRRISITH
jgi:hypothetical protein